MALFNGPEVVWASRLTPAGLCAVMTLGSKPVPVGKTWTVRVGYSRKREDITITTSDLCDGLTRLMETRRSAALPPPMGASTDDVERFSRTDDRLKAILKRADVVTFDDDTRWWKLTPRVLATIGE
jgi:hypothetical protein